jgi:hypothetical protein
VIHRVGTEHTPRLGSGDQFCVLRRVTSVCPGCVAMFRDHLAVDISDKGSVRRASVLPGFMGQHEGSPKQGKVGHVIRVGLATNRRGADEGNSDQSDQNPRAEQHRPPMQILHGRACYPSNNEGEPEIRWSSDRVELRVDGVNAPPMTNRFLRPAFHP